MSTHLARLIAVCILAVASTSSADGGKPSTALDPRGQPDERLIDQPQRYYVWHDAEGWHLRSAAKGMIKFEGTIRVIGGTFRKCRPVGLDTKGRYADRSVLDDKRQQLQFQLHTSTSFDGFDFTVGEGATEIEFDLSSAGGRHPRRIFVGRKGEHPRNATFRLAADPDRRAAKTPGATP